jgi:hypothetical protein
MTSPTTDRAHMTEIDPADLPTLISGHRSALVILTDRPGPEGGTSAGDLVYLRTVSGQVVAAGRVDRVDEFADLTSHDLRLLRESHGARTIGTGSVWSSKPDARFATVVWLKSVRPVVNASGVPAGLLAPTRHAWQSVAPAESPSSRAA